MIKPKKAVVVIEKPERCVDCPLVSINPYPQDGFECRITGETSIRTDFRKLDSCPLQDYAENSTS